MSKAAFLAASGLKLYTAALKQKELTRIFTALLGDPQPAFGIDADTGAKLAAVFADLWSKGHQAIAEQMVKNLLERGEDPADAAGMESLFLRAAALEMGKLSMHFKNTRGKFELVQSTALFLYLTRSMQELGLVKLSRLSDEQAQTQPAELNVEELIARATALREKLDAGQMQQEIRSGALSGLSVKQLEDMKNYDATPRSLFSGFSGKGTVFIAAAVILVIFFIL